jgi:hypothetical protein
MPLMPIDSSPINNKPQSIFLVVHLAIPQSYTKWMS